MAQPADHMPALPFMPSDEERPKIEEAQRLQANIDRLLVAIGDTGRCSGCNATIVWVVHKNGRKAPYDADAVNHFVSCPNRDQFRKRGKP